MADDAEGSDESMDSVRAAVRGVYTVERLLGRGGMGAVYLGRDVTLDRPVAIKVINPDVAGSGLLRDRFLQEARSVARLRHPNIVSVYTAGESNGLLYFAMELVDGLSLRELLEREGRLPAERAERIISEIALALDHAHSHGLVHRDVKPDNILIEAASGRALLTDFGISRMAEATDGLTMTGVIVGSPRYMAPEQISGDGPVDGRADLYALALVGYELFSGVAVVEHGSVATMIYKHMTETPPPLATKVPGIPERLSTAIARGLAKDPAARWQTGAEFAEAISGGSVAVLRPTVGAGVGQPPVATRRNRMVIAAVAGVAAIAVALGVNALRGGGATGDAYLVAPFEIQSGDASVTWLREGSVNMLTLTLAQFSDLRVIDYERTLSLLDAEQLGAKPRLSAEDAFDLARRARAGTVVMGQVQTTPDSLIVIATLYDVGSGKSEQRAQESIALGSDPRPLFDRLAQKLLNIEGFVGTSTVQLASATTSSLQAYRAYLDGVKLLNTWRLAEADRDFARAIALDSTFALAYHKRSLGLGWSQAGGPEYIRSAERAFQLAARLPPRERTLVEGHYHLALAIAAGNGQDTAAARREFDQSIRAYSAVIGPPRNDSLVAEAWYGLADSYYHGRTGQAFGRYTTESLRGFHRTLAIDSTYHLAYSHLVQLYNQAAGEGPLLIAGDSAVMRSEPAGRGLDSARVALLRAEARARGIAIAKAWARADDGSAQPFVQLAQSYLTVNHSDSALLVLRKALERPRSGAAGARVALVEAEHAVSDTGAATTLRYILDRFTPDSLREVTLQNRLGASGTLMTLAASRGNHADTERAQRLAFATDSTLPFSPQSSAPMLDFFRIGLDLAMGDSLTAARRRGIINAGQWIDAMPNQYRTEVRRGSANVPYLAFLVSHDTAFQRMAVAWIGSPLPELDAHLALDRGDTTAAMQIARAFPSPDSLRKARFGLGGMRSVARAEVLERLGQLRPAAETYAATELNRFNRNSPVEPGMVVWVRTWLSRAKLWEQLGDRDQAIASYEEFIRRWKDADGTSAKLVEQAKQSLSRLRDSRPGRL